MFLAERVAEKKRRNKRDRERYRAKQASTGRVVNTGGPVPWQTRFEDLQAYMSQNGTCDVPAREKGLGSWVTNQRRVYRAGKLQQDRIEKLNSIGFNWGYPQWESRFDELLAYKAQNGTCYVPQREKTGLGRWVKKQRELYLAGTLRQDRIDKLNSIGFTWNGRRGCRPDPYFESVRDAGTLPYCSDADTCSLMSSIAGDSIAYNQPLMVPQQLDLPFGQSNKDTSIGNP